jgi:hypothetical protein
MIITVTVIGGSGVLGPNLLHMQPLHRNMPLKSWAGLS